MSVLRQGHSVKITFFDVCTGLHGEKLDDYYNVLAGLICKNASCKLFWIANTGTSRRNKWGGGNS